MEQKPMEHESDRVIRGAEPASYYYAKRIDDLAMDISGLTDGIPLCKNALRKISRNAREILVVAHMILAEQTENEGQKRDSEQAENLRWDNNCCLVRVPTGRDCRDRVLGMCTALRMRNDGSKFMCAIHGEVLRGGRNPVKCKQCVDVTKDGGCK